jgi:hypothetical protein
MQEQDLQQIKKIVDESLRANNEILRKEIQESEEKITSAVNDGFTEIQVEIDSIKEELKKKANEATVLSWGDERITPIKLDVDRLKYLHKDKWKGLPDSGTISRVLVEEGIKN